MKGTFGWPKTPYQCSQKNPPSKTPNDWLCDMKAIDTVTRDYIASGNGAIVSTKMFPKLDNSGLQFYYLE